MTARYRGWHGSLRRAVLVGALVGGVPFQGNAQATSNGTASARLDKPIVRSITGGACESDGKGDVGANFSNMPAFNIGPATIGVPEMSKAPYTGPGSYRKVIITGYPKKGVRIYGLGTVVVNSDRRTGTFATDDGTASGSWDCGIPLR